MKQPDTILVMDFGGQYTQLIARRVRELAVYSEIVSYATPLTEIQAFNPKGIILSGGPRSVYETGSPTIPEEFFTYCKENSIPVLGICYGLQLIGQVFGGQITSFPRREYGKIEVNVNPEDLLEGLDATESVWMSHGDQITEPPAGFEVIASSETCPIAAIQKKDDHIYAVQFHVEVSHTPKGMQILRNFVFNICKCNPNWIMADFIDDAISKIRETVGEEKVIMAVSGGVDSTVAAILIERAIGDDIFCIFVDNGLMRKSGIA